MKIKKKDCFCSGNSINRSEGEYTIIVVRSGFTLHFDLPYIILGSMYLPGNNFATGLQEYLPPGITVTTVQTVFGGNPAIAFIYTDGIDTDNIILFSVPDAMLSYPELLSNLNTNYMRSELMYFCNNTQVPGLPLLTDAQNKLIQSKPLFLQKLGMGKKANEVITPLSRKLANNSVSDLIEISLRHQEIKPNTVWVHKFAYLHLTEHRDLVFYWQIIFNEIINMNDEKLCVEQTKEAASK
jgi:hypothetical protein